MECLSILEKIGEKLNIPNILLYNSYRKFSKAQNTIYRIFRTFPPKRLEEMDVIIFGYLLKFLNSEEITEKELYSLWWLITAFYTDDNPYGTWWIARGLRMNKHEFDNNCVNLSLKLSCPLLKIVNNEVYSKEYKEILLQ
tara:strand:- start:4719 stop:5138 length:420 start_codon:yes stop_codon:yes gene_type:complete